MAIEVATSETETKPELSLNETGRIMDEMDRLLNEMKEMMSTIKRIMGDEIEWQAHMSSNKNETAYLRSENIVLGS